MFKILFLLRLRELLVLLMRRLLRVRGVLLRRLWQRMFRLRQHLQWLRRKLLRGLQGQLRGLLRLFRLRRLFRVLRLFFRVLRTVQGLLLHRLHGHLHGDLRGPVLRFGHCRFLFREAAHRYGLMGKKSRKLG